MGVEGRVVTCANVHVGVEMDKLKGEIMHYNHTPATP